MEIIELRIADAQKKHDNELLLLVEERDNEIMKANEQFEDDKADLEETIVKEVLGKVI
jgi:hypothetical protein